jgi:hexosaminidase
MNYKNFSSLFILLLIGIMSCKSNQPPSDLAVNNLIPKPVSVTATGEVFSFTSESAIYVEGNSVEHLKIGQYLADKLKPATGFDLKVSATNGTPKAGNIYLIVAGNDTALGEEGYELIVTKEMIKVTANKPAGLFRSMQTICQLLPARVELSTIQQGPWEIPTGTIRDYPNYSYRGSMLDVARHFFSVDDVKRYIDLISYYKMNVLHLHLSDDQGWRIEIKSWPNLTTQGGSTEVSGGKGGFYTQEQYKDIVQYALDRYITIIPEIDMPGHTNAALASYAEFNCNNTATKLYTGIEVGFSSLCTKKEITYKFIDDVIRELAALTPGPYLHIGGDESHATKKEDYIPFVNRVQDIVKKHGKLAIGWDEIALSTLQPNSVAQFWADADNSKEAVNQGSKILMSPAKKAYLDMQYDSTTKLGLHWAAYIEVDSAYTWDPATLVNSITRKNILGIEAALWTETITKMDEIEFMVFPRLPGYAEIGWSPATGRSWNEYEVRLGNHGARMKAMNIDFYKSKKVAWVE